MNILNYRVRVTVFLALMLLAFLFFGSGLNAVVPSAIGTTAFARPVAASSGWTLKTPQLSPRARSYHSMTYDPINARTLMFGGYGWQETATGGGALQLNDTWTWDGSSWQQQFPLTSPSGRMATTMTYDSARGETILFGGRDLFGQPLEVLGDTWTWDGHNWNLRQVTNPPPARAYAGMAFDALHQETVLFGGWNGVSGADHPPSDLPLADTWIWDGSSWTQRFPSSIPPPSLDVVLIYDSAHHEVVLLEGVGNYGYGFGCPKQTWTWDGTNWTQRFPTSTPSVDYPAAMFDETNQRVVIFGGRDCSTGLGSDQIWDWDGTDWSIRSVGNGPSPREGAAISSDPVRGVATLFGGDPGNGALVVADTWELQLTSTPNSPPTAGFTMTSGSLSATEGKTLNISAPTGPVFVGFSANRSSDPDGTVVAWNWKVDGNSVSTANSFTYGLNIGSHTVSLVVTDNQGAQSVAAQGVIVISLLKQLNLFPSHDVDSNHPLYIRAENVKRTQKTISADIVVTNVTGAWFQLNINFNAPSAGTAFPVEDNQIPLVFLIGPFGERTFRTQFSEGQYLQFDATRTSVSAFSILAIDMIGRGLFGIELPNVTAFVDLSTTIIAELINEVRNNCGGSALELGVCLGKHDLICLITKLAEFLKCSVTNDQVRKALTKVLTKYYGSQAAKKWIEFGSRESTLIVLELLSLIDRLPKMAVLYDATVNANLGGWIRLEARR